MAQQNDKDMTDDEVINLAMGLGSAATVVHSSSSTPQEKEVASDLAAGLAHKAREKS